MIAAVEPPLSVKVQMTSGLRQQINPVYCAIISKYRSAPVTELTLTTVNSNLNTQHDKNAVNRTINPTNKSYDDSSTLVCIFNPPEILGHHTTFRNSNKSVTDPNATSLF